MNKNRHKTTHLFSTILQCFSFLAAFTACGELNYQDKVNINNKSPSQFTQKLIEPVQMPGKWKRRVSYNNPDSLERVTIEKKVEGGSWIMAGVLDRNNSWIDTEIDKNIRYRIGSKIESNIFYAIKDIVLTQELFNKAKDKNFTGYRIIIPKTPQPLILQTSDLKLDCSILVLDANIFSFTNKKTAGRNAGTLQIVSPKIVGEGYVSMHGETGNTGSHGRNATLTKNGKSGGNGGNGGNGGHIILPKYLKGNLDRKYLVSAGAGGARGLGGSSYSGTTDVNLLKSIWHKIIDKVLGSSLPQAIAFGERHLEFHDRPRAIYRKGGKNGHPGAAGLPGKISFGKQKTAE